MSYEEIRFENRRRDLNTAYAKAISADTEFVQRTDGAGSRSSTASGFEKWLMHRVKSNKVYSKELLSSARRQHRWDREKQTQRFYGLAADAMCGCLPPRRNGKINHRVRVLCFGDLGGTGTCSWNGIKKHKRHLSFKRFIRECASRIPIFMMDEYGTSFSCPGCSSDMVTIDKQNRIRTCKGKLSNDACCLQLRDRDEHAAVQMVLGAMCRLIHGTRPPHLKRPTRTTSV